MQRLTALHREAEQKSSIQPLGCLLAQRLTALSRCLLVQRLTALQSVRQQFLLTL
ncbi:MAG: hypothetical protein JNM84_16655 [Planctomycetes bacterium]|nr:hypothetical protein [Planctomycetota bacterium]